VAFALQALAINSGEPRILRVEGGVDHPLHRFEAGLARGGTNVALQLRRAQAMEEAAIHATAIQNGQRAAIGIRQNCFAAEFGGDR
jgi:hypothetical protein